MGLITIGTKAAQNRPLGMLVLLLACLASWVSAHRAGVGSVDAYSLHLLALGILDGLRVYDPAVQAQVFEHTYGMGPPPGLFYPPVTAIVVAPLGLLPVRLAADVLWVVLVAAVVLGVRQLCLLLRPAANWPLLAGLLLASACVRWGITPLQTAPLVLGLLAGFYVALVRGNCWLSAGAAGVALALKMTMALPFIGLLLLYRRFGTCVALGVLWLGLNALGFYRVGGLDAWHAYVSNMAVVEGMGDINTPDPWQMISIPRLDWVYLAYGITRQLLLSRLLAPLTCLACLAYLLWKGLKLGTPPRNETTEAYLMPLTCLTLLAVYHHHYDLSLAAVPLLVTGLRGGKAALLDRRNLLLLPMVGLMALAPVGLLQTALYQVSALAVGVVRLSFPIALTLTLWVSLRHIRELTGPAGTAVTT